MWLTLFKKTHCLEHTKDNLSKTLSLETADTLCDNDDVTLCLPCTLWGNISVLLPLPEILKLASPSHMRRPDLSEPLYMYSPMYPGKDASNRLKFSTAFL
jgi:hypothetical protein